MNKKSQSGFHLVLIAILIVVIGVVGFAGMKVVQKNKAGKSTSSVASGKGSAEEKAIAAGKILSSNKCSGTGDATFTSLPMKESDFGILVPYGLVVGGHVTPIDHQYFTPKDYNSARDSYPVYAMADATITEISPRTTERGTEYRFVFAHSCTFLYYYDLVTSLYGDVKTAYEKSGHNLTLKVKAGQQVGSIGGQTLDFAVWRTTDTLKGFINPASYDAEGWKIYTANPTPYYTAELQKIIADKNPRKTEPTEGKIDYDVAGKLIGNWFVKGSGGYHGKDNTKQNYWAGHLSIVPDLYDPSHFLISLGSFAGGDAAQFADANNSPDPATVGVDTGLVKYDLSGFGYYTATEPDWRQMTVATNPKLKSDGSSKGCLLVQLTDDNTVKAESFKSKACSAITAFDSSAQVYVR